ncbi:MAG: DNA (cytosine-5)-methyltransferase 1 [Lentisphaeria bacterium]|jgi:DNA (cytosine-5)-methyltransferase 1
MKKSDKKQKIKPTIACVDLFCGAGGLTHGLLQGGVDVRAGIDIDPASKYPYEENNNSLFLEKNIKHLSATEIKSYFEGADYCLLAGCAPCQPFSTYSQGKRELDGGKWSLLKSFGKLVGELKPDFVTMENVPQLSNHPVYKSFLKNLDGYHTWVGTVQCPQYGIPQTRKRFVLLASRLGPIDLLAPTHDEDSFVSVKDAIGALPKIKAGGTSGKDALHTAPKLSELNMRRIKQSKPGGTWRDWDDELVAECHKKLTGATFPSVYGRMIWGKPAPTITTQCFGYGNGRFGHPVQNRAISLREAAIFQTFPETYKFIPKGDKPRFSTLGRLIGNAVPVRLGEVIAESFFLHLRNVA